MAYGTINVDKMVSSDGAASGGLYGFKNRIINGAMVIDQRNAGASVTISTTGGGQYTLDRWFGQASQSSKFSVQQNAGSVTPPVGFTKYLGVTSLSAYSIGSGDYFSVKQVIEGFNGADLGFGTANASAVTLSFRVYSSLTGTFGGVLQNGGFNRSYPFTYTVSSANTWTTVSVTIAGDTSGTWATDNSGGLVVIFGLGVGSTYSGAGGSWAGSNYISATGATSVVGTNGATFYITGVQLEKGSTATSFDYRPYGTELALCQRYFEKSYIQTNAVGTATVQGYSASTVPSNTVTSGTLYSQISFATVKRAAPTVTLYGYQGGTNQVSNGSTGTDLGANSGLTNSTGTQGFGAANGSGGSITTAIFGVIYHWTASSEL
jgi:hypothetical protein